MRQPATDEQAQIRSQFSDMERESVAHKKDNGPKNDVLNVLAGHNTFTDRDEREMEANPLANPNDKDIPAQIPTAELEIRTALPHANPNPPGGADYQHAASHLIAEQGAAYYADILGDQISANIAARARGVGISDHEGVALLIRDIKDAEARAAGRNPAARVNPNEASKGCRTLLKHLVYKAKMTFDEGDPGIREDRSSREINENIPLRNQQFQRQMYEHKNAINTLLNTDPTRTIKNNGAELAIDHVCRVELEAAKLETDFRTEKQLLLEHAAQTINLLASASNIDEKLEKLTADKQKVERELEAVFKEFPEGSDKRAALQWTAQEIRLKENYNRNPNPANEQAVTAHRDTRPGLLSDPNKTATISTQLDKVSHIQRRINRIERQQQRLEESRPALLLADLDRQKAAFLKAQGFVDDDVASRYAEGLDLYLESHRLEAVYDKTGAPEDLAKSQAFDRENQANFERPDEGHEREAMHQLINQIAEHQVQNQKVESLDTLRASPEYQIAQAQMDYEANLRLTNTMVANTDNPRTDALKGAHRIAKAAHDTYVAKVQEVHKANGTEDILRSVSAPLKELRENRDKTPQEKSANPLSTMGTLFFTGPLPFVYQGLAYLGGLAKDKFKDMYSASQEAETTQLPILDITKCHPAEGVPRPDCLAGISNKTQEVNQLFKEREELEIAVAAHPSMARDMVPQIQENTDKLHETMTELLENAVATDDAGLFVTYEDQKAKDEWVRKLQAAARGVEAASNKSLPTAAKTDAQKSTRQVSRNQNSARHLNTKRKTTYSESLGDGRSREVTLKAKVKQKDGTDKMEDVEFTHQELDAELTKFCKEKDLKVNHVGDKRRIGFIDNNTVRMQRDSNGETTFRWPSQQLKADWIKHLSGAYTAKRELEIAKEKENDKAPENVGVDAHREALVEEGIRAERVIEIDDDDDDEPMALRMY